MKTTAKPATEQHSLQQRLAALGAVAAADGLMARLAADFDTPEALISWLGDQLRMPWAQMKQLMAWQPEFTALGYADCARQRCAVALDGEGCTRLLITDPFDVDRLAWARSALASPIATLVSQDTLDAWLAHCEQDMTALASMTSAGTAGAQATALGAEVLDLRDISTHENPAVRFVNSTLYDALKAGASDIHLECHPQGLGVKFRIDGVLVVAGHLDSAEIASQAISRIKVMAELDIAERRVPQDGRLQISINRRLIDVRVSIMPSIHGEDAVLRVLDRQHLAQTLEGLTLAQLGFNHDAITTLQRWSRKPHGMMLVTGPTGSGKTTTLYAAIAETHNPRDKIITIEDPVEYQLPGVLQIPVNERKGLSFARGLRSILRHDPDKILVGEIRDSETAQIAVQSALTGHLVFTTVHANNAFDVLGRFTQFDIDPYTFSAAINGILAQRLLRKVCGHCAAPAALPQHLPPEQEREAMGGRPQSHRWLTAVGCEHCRGTGYLGRFALGEVLEMTPAIKGLMANRAPLDQLQAEALRSGWRGLRQLALEAAGAGITTMEEVDRVAS